MKARSDFHASAARSRRALLALALAAAAGCAQGQVAGSSVVGTAAVEVREVAPGWSVSRQLLGLAVVNEHGEPIGHVQDIIVTPDAAVSHFIVGTGGFLGMRRHRVAVPIEALLVASGKLVVVGATPGLMALTPNFEYTR